MKANYTQKHNNRAMLSVNMQTALLFKYIKGVTV